MSENKYQPPVNMPERIPSAEAPTQPTAVLVQFLSTDGHWMGFNSDDLQLCQKDKSTVTLCAQVGDKVIHLLTYPGVELNCVPIAEKTIVVP